MRGFGSRSRVPPSPVPSATSFQSSPSTLPCPHQLATFTALTLFPQRHPIFRASQGSPFDSRDAALAHLFVGNGCLRHCQLSPICCCSCAAASASSHITPNCARHTATPAPPKLSARIQDTTFAPIAPPTFTLPQLQHKESTTPIIPRLESRATPPPPT